MKLEIKYSTFKKILIIVLLLNIILGISIYSEVKQISNQEQMKYILIFLAVIAIFLLGYLIGHYKGYMEGWNSIVKTDAGPKPDPKLVSYIEKGYIPRWFAFAMCIISVILLLLFIFSVVARFIIEKS